MANYMSVNGAWPDVLPPISNVEAIALVRKLHRKFLPRRVLPPVKLTSGVRLTWKRGDTFYVNPKREKWVWREGIEPGWKDIVHLLSHYVHGKLHPNADPHDGKGRHAFIERSMIEHIIKSGWLEGNLKRVKATKPPPSKEEQEASKLKALDDRIKRWNTKLKRAETALAKLNKKRKRMI